LLLARAVVAARAVGITVALAFFVLVERGAAAVRFWIGLVPRLIFLFLRLLLCQLAAREARGTTARLLLGGMTEAGAETHPSIR
jgi:hypothetical protein